MPEAAVHEDHHALPLKSEIWPTWKFKVPSPTRDTMLTEEMHQEQLR
jgi:hypothetical protein